MDLTFTIKNTGDPDLTGLGIIIDGTDADSFSVIASPTGPVSSPNGSTTFTVLFAPTTPGVKIAALHIASNDVDENPFDVTLTGTGGIPTRIPRVTALPTGNNLTLLWPDSATGYRVESTLSLSPPVTWSNVAGSFQTVGGSISIVLPITGGQKFYRLVRP